MSEVEKGVDKSRRRSAERKSINATARLRETGRTPFDVELKDLSITGCRMVTFARLHIGTKMWINLSGLAPQEAVVRRCEGTTYGCEFVNPLHPAVAEHLQNQLSESNRVIP